MNTAMHADASGRLTVGRHGGGPIAEIAPCAPQKQVEKKTGKANHICGQAFSASS
jgi:hypothetical protein